MFFFEHFVALFLIDFEKVLNILFCCHVVLSADQDVPFEETAVQIVIKLVYVLALAAFDLLISEKKASFSCIYSAMSSTSCSIVI